MQLFCLRQIANYTIFLVEMDNRQAHIGWISYSEFLQNSNHFGSNLIRIFSQALKPTYQLYHFIVEMDSRQADTGWISFSDLLQIGIT